MKLSLITFMLSCVCGFAQQTLSDKEICKLLKAKQIEWYTGDDYNMDMYAKVQLKKGKKWGIYKIDTYKPEPWDDKDFYYEEIVPAKFDSLGWFTDFDYKFTIVKQKDKYGLLLYPGEVSDAVDKVHCKYDKIVVKQPENTTEYSYSYDSEIYVLVKQNNKWGLIDWFTGNFIVDPVCSTIKEVPLIQLEGWQVDELQTIKTNLKADIVQFDNNNGDGVFKARNRVTKLWGMYQGGYGKYKQLVPAKFNNVDMFKVNGLFTGVYKNNKVGIYLSAWSYYDKAKQTIPCIYDDYKNVYYKGNHYLAAKKNNKWGWVNWITGEVKTNFNYESVDALPPPSYVQETTL